MRRLDPKYFYIKLSKNVAIFSVAAFFAFALPTDSLALRLVIKKVVFEDGKRAEDIIIINKSEEEEVYRISWRPMVMKEDGTLDRKVPDQKEGTYVSDDPFDVSNMVKYAPRRVTVPPNSSQQIRLMLRMPEGLPDGEYRNHIFINTEKLGNEFDVPSGRGITAVPLPGVSIPVFVRKGETGFEISLNDLQARNEGENVVLSYDIGRTGNQSAYLRLVAVCNPGASDAYILRVINNLALYTDVQRRAQSLRIPKEAGKGACRELGMRIYEAGEDNKKKLAERVITVYNN